MTTKKTFKVIRNKSGAIDIDETLLEHRHVFINDVILDKNADDVVKQLLVLDMISNKPIQVYVNSPGGSVTWGFAIIDIMKQIRSKIITIAHGQVASMGTLISIAGDERKCFPSTTFMFHDMTSGMMDYSAKMKARADHLENHWLKLKSHVKEHTKLSAKELERMRSEELWMFADEALTKGLVDVII